MTSEKNVNAENVHEENIINDLLAKFKEAYRTFIEWKFKSGIPGFHYPYHHKPENRDIFPEQEEEYMAIENNLLQEGYSSEDITRIKYEIESDFREAYIAKVTKDAEEAANALTVIIEEMPEGEEKKR